MDTQTSRGDRFSVLVGAELKGAIRSRGWRAVDVAERIDVHEVTLSRYLNGHRLVPASVVVDAAEAIGMSPEEIVDRAYSRLLAEMGPPADPNMAVAPVREYVDPQVWYEPAAALDHDREYIEREQEETEREP